jgi:hypothetical protein
MHALLQEAAPDPDEVRAAFARAARLALVGLLAAPAMLGLASVAGFPLRAAVGPAFWFCAAAGFAGAGWLAGRRLGVGPRRTAALAAACLAAGLIVAHAFQGLQGLTGRESALTVAAATLPSFTAAFTLVGALGGRALGIAPLGVRAMLTCAVGGLIGGVCAMLPFVWAWLQIDVPGESIVAMGLAIIGFLGCLIAPFQIAGFALDGARRSRALARV